MQREVGFKGTLRAVLRLHAHQPQVPAEEPRGADSGLLQPEEARSTPRFRRSSRWFPRRRSRSGRTSRSARNSRPAARTSRGRPTARAPAPSSSTPTICRRAARGRRRPCSSTRASRATISRSAWRRKIPRFRRSCASAATPPTSRAGRSTPRRSVTTWASTRTRTRASATSTTRCCARCGWSSTPASTPRVGPANRRSTTCCRIRAWAKTDATAEVERYIAIPSQATAYKIGALTIQRLRARGGGRARRKFDIREFHAQVLDSGALPMTILEQKIHRWIAAKKAS